MHALSFQEISSFASPGSALKAEAMPHPDEYPVSVGGEFPDPVPFSAQYPGATPQVCGSGAWVV